MKLKKQTLSTLCPVSLSILQFLIRLLQAHRKQTKQTFLILQPTDVDEPC